MTTKFPKSIDQFTPVFDGNPVFSKDINEIADALPALEDHASGVLLANSHAETDYAGTTRRREVVMNTDFYPDPAGATKDYTDVGVVLRDSSGTPIPGAWTSTDYAVNIQVDNLSSVPGMPKSFSETPSTVTGKKPYRFNIIGYSPDGTTATLRIFNDNTSFDDFPYMLKVSPDASTLFALCGTNISNMELHMWDASTNTYISGAKIEKPSWMSSFPAGTSISLFVRDFCVAPGNTDGEWTIYILYRKLASNDCTHIHRYTQNGKLIATDPFVPSNVSGYNFGYLSSITADLDGGVYIAAFDLNSCGTCRHLSEVTSIEQHRASILKYSPTGAFVGMFTEDKGLFGDHFSYSYCYALTYNTSDGCIYAHILDMHHRKHSGTLAPHPIIRSLNKNLVSQSVMQLKKDVRAGGPLAVTTSDGNTYGYMLDIWSRPGDYAINITDTEAPKGPCSIRVFNLTDGTEMTPITTSRSGLPYSANRPTGIVAVRDKVYACDVAEKQLDIANASDQSWLDSIYPADPEFAPAVRTTLMTCADKKIHLTLSGTGNFVKNPDLSEIAGEASEYIPTSSFPLLKNKPAPVLKGDGGYGWGFLQTAAIDPNANLWKNVDGLNGLDTRAFRVDNSSGSRVVTTGAAAVTKEQLGWVYDPDDNPCLYIPAAWMGRYEDREDYENVEFLCSSAASPDTVPYASTATAKVCGSIAVPILDVEIPRAKQPGDVLWIHFKHQEHILYTMQDKPYDNRILKAYAFIQVFDATGTPLQLTVDGKAEVYPDGSAKYRLDCPISTLGTSSTYANMATPHSPSPWLKYKGTTSYSTFMKSVPLPDNANRVRLGFAIGVMSHDKDVNVLTGTGQSGGMYIDDINISLIQ